MTFRLTPAAEADLAEIADYIATEFSPDRADVVIRAIFKAADVLAETPRIGHSREDLTDKSVLVWPVASYLVFYLPDTQPLEIIRVIHGARDWKVIEDALQDHDLDG